MSAQRIGIAIGAGKVGIAQMRVNGAVADRVDGYGAPIVPIFGPAFRQRMMPFDTLAQRPAAKPASRALITHFGVQADPIHLPDVLAFMLMFMPLGAPVIFMSMCMA